jgi:hypothetical protein
MHQRAIKPAPPYQPGARRDTRLDASPVSGHDGGMEQQRVSGNHTVSPNRGQPAGGAWDFSKIPIVPPERVAGFQPWLSESDGTILGPSNKKRSLPPISQPGNTDPAQRDPPQLGSWARSLLRAPETKPSDTAEQSADRAASAAVRNERPSRISAAAKAPDAGTPPWGSGRRLSRDELQWHEPRAGANLDEVRVHEGAVPERWATLLGARAFTIGRDVVVGGEYAPGTDTGRRLMAHELSHVVMARGHAPVLARVALAAADFDALADSLHDSITATAADEELIYVALQKLERDPTAINSLTNAYKSRHTTDLLTDLGARLKGHGLDLAKTLLGAKGGLTVATKPPSTAAEYEAVARAVNTALAAKSVDAAGVYAALLPLAQNPSQAATLKTTYATLFTTGLEAAVTAKLTGAGQSYALYLLNAPGPAVPHAPTTFKAQPGPGVAPSTAPPPVAGGTVTAETKVPYETKAGNKGTYGFGVGYSGALSADSRWLQFIEREIDYDPKDGGKRTALDEEIESTSGAGTNKYRLTTVTSSPKWIVDSTNPSNPFFDETHSNDAWRTATSVSTYDAPAPRGADVKKLFDAGHTGVTSRAHFEIYLIRDFSAIYHVEIEIVWTFSDPKTSTISRTVKSTAAVTGLPSPLKTALVAQYPAYAYIR